jgi:hypothetical protein
MLNSNDRNLLTIVPRTLLALSLLVYLVVGCTRESKPNRVAKRQTKASVQSDAASEPTEAVSDQRPAEPATKNETSEKPLSAELPYPRTEDLPTNPAAPNVKQREFSEAQLHKNANLLLLAMEPDIRARELIKYLRAYLSEDQQAAAVKLILQYDEKFQDIKRRRAAILENASDEEPVPQRLRKIKEETIIFSDEMRLMVEREIMTDEQRQQRLADRKQARALNNR